MKRAFVVRNGQACFESIFSRARREQQARELERTLTREEVSKGHRSFRDIAPVICGTSSGVIFSGGISAVQSSAEDKVCRRFNLFGLGPDSYGQPQLHHHANEDTKDKKPQPFSSEPDEYSVPNLESLLENVWRR